MNLKNTAYRIAEEMGEIPKTHAVSLLKRFLAVLAQEIADYGEVFVAGLGTFRVIETSAKPGRNPKTGESLIIPAKKRVRFKAALNLQKRLR
jgi:nucleoid DNA-binding protein